jgi:hypothetical protein
MSASEHRPDVPASGTAADIFRASAAARAREIEAGLEHILAGPLLHYDLNQALDYARACVRALANALEFDLDLGLARAPVLADDLDLGFTHMREVILGDNARRDREIITVHNLASDLIRYVARYFAGEINMTLNRPASQAVSGRQQRTCSIASSAGRLLAAAARLLPAADRGRYAEEYRSELWEIASTGTGRLQQVRYAVSQLARAAHLRAAVMTPRRRNASP